MPGGIDRWIARALDALALVSSALVTGLLFLLVLTRYVFGWDFSEAHDLSLLAAMFLYMVGAVIASRRREHLAVDFVPSRLARPSARALHRLVEAAVTAVITAFFIYWSYRMFLWGIARPQTTPALRLPLWIPQIAIMLAAVGCFAYAVRDLLGAVRALRRGEG
jgi:TRAP-type C4-dicarboxylate transport system permease small subunit